jgi:hypothetical protein
MASTEESLASWSMDADAACIAAAAIRQTLDPNQWSVLESAHTPCVNKLTHAGTVAHQPMTGGRACVDSASAAAVGAAAGSRDLYFHGSGGVCDAAAKPCAGQPYMVAAAWCVLGCCTCRHHGAAGITATA